MFVFGNVNKDSIASNSDNSFMELSQRSRRVLTEIGFLAEIWNPGTRKTTGIVHLSTEFNYAKGVLTKIFF